MQRLSRQSKSQHQTRLDKSLNAKPLWRSKHRSLSRLLKFLSSLQRRGKFAWKYLLMRFVTPISTRLTATILRENSPAFWATKLLQLLKVLEKMWLIINLAIWLFRATHRCAWNGIASFVDQTRLTCVRKYVQLKDRDWCLMGRVAFQLLMVKWSTTLWDVQLFRSIQFWMISLWRRSTI